MTPGSSGFSPRPVARLEAADPPSSPRAHEAGSRLARSAAAAVAGRPGREPLKCVTRQECSAGRRPFASGNEGTTSKIHDADRAESR